MEAYAEIYLYIFSYICIHMLYIYKCDLELNNKPIHMCFYVWKSFILSANKCILAYGMISSNSRVEVVDCSSSSSSSSSSSISSSSCC